jgi:hypothetical protein
MKNSKLQYYLITGDTTIRFMVLVKADKNKEAGALPDEKLLPEIRQLFEAEDFGPALTPELREANERLRSQVDVKR